MELTETNLKAALSGADILVNATSVGMTPNVNETVVPARLIRPGLVVLDVVYNPIETRLLREAETGIEQQGVEVTIDRAFTDDF